MTLGFALAVVAVVFAGKRFSMPAVPSVPTGADAIAEAKVNADREKAD